MTLRWIRSVVCLPVLLLGLVSCHGPELRQAATAVRIDDGPRAVMVGATLELTATVDAGDRVDQAVHWWSGDESIATVDDAGLITGVAPGDVEIGAASVSDMGKYDTVTVTVLPGPAVVSVSINEPDTSLTVGEAADLSVTVVAVGDVPTEVAWASDDPAVAEVDERGFVMAHAPGQANVTATSVFDGSTFDTVTVTVLPAPAVLSVSINEPDVSLTVGEATDFTVTVMVVGDASSEVAWTSDDPAVASVDQGGIVTAQAPGQAEVTATSAFDGSTFDTVTVTVVPGQAVLNVRINEPDVSLTVGDAAGFTVTVELVGDVPAEVAWASDDPAVAGVDQGGIVTAHAPGQVAITATSVFDENQYDSITITVTALAWDVRNPYEAVDWSTTLREKANLHTHTTESDGAHTPAEAIDAYREAGYRVLALTDHNLVTWPWTTYGRDPDALGIVAVQGSEPSRHHHLGTYFCDCPGSRTLAETMTSVRDQNGIAMVAHPGRYVDKEETSVTDYVEWYLQWPELIGMEVYNQRDRYQGDRALWDEVLVALLPFDRPVWAMANDDMHILRLLGYSWNLLLLPELSSAEVRSSLEAGRFFFVHVPGGPTGGTPPEVRSITVDAENSTITIDATGYARIEWIANGTVVAEGSQFDLESKGVEGYVRAMLYASTTGGPAVGTQPFFLRRTDN